MTKLLSKLLPVLLALASSTAMAASGWQTDYDKALSEARFSRKLLVMDFTGSDWCGWCKKLNREVFSKPEFQTFAKDNLVLLEVDFPRNKHLSEKLQAQNNKLQRQFAVHGFPSIIVLNSEGKKVGQLGYMAGGPAPFIAELQKLKSK